MKLEDLFREHNIPFKRAGEHHHACAGWLQMDCPKCGRGTKKYHMGFNTYGRYFNCFRCGKMDAVEVVSDLLDVTTGQAIGILKEAEVSSGPVTAIQAKVSGKLRLPYGLGPLAKPHRLYLKRRGFDPDELVKLYKIQAIKWAPKLAWRIFIPIFNKAGEMVSWTTRAILKNDPLRYVSASLKQEKESHKTLLYSENLVEGHSICVVEGPISQWAVDLRLGLQAGAALSDTTIPLPLHLV